MYILASATTYQRARLKGMADSAQAGQVSNCLVVIQSSFNVGVIIRKITVDFSMKTERSRRDTIYFLLLFDPTITVFPFGNLGSTVKILQPLKCAQDQPKQGPALTGGRPDAQCPNPTTPDIPRCSTNIHRNAIIACSCYAGLEYVSNSSQSFRLASSPFLEPGSMNDLVINSQLATSIIDDHDTNAASAIGKGLAEPRP